MANADEQRRAEIQKQIALLQSQLNDPPLKRTARVSPEPSPVLAPGTPSPTKKRKRAHPSTTVSLASSLSAPVQCSQQAKQRQNVTTTTFTAPTPSNLLNKLAAVKARGEDEADAAPEIMRSLGFAERPAMPQPTPSSSLQTRDDRGAIIEDIPIGPADHVAPFDDPRHERLEPNSGIRLLSRSLSHEDLQEHLSGRFFVSPSRLYSCVKLLPDKQGYDIPVAGDWVTIAVVAERGPIRFSKAPVELGPDEDAHQHKKKKQLKDEKPKPSGKRYVNLKLIDFGARSGGSSTGGKSVIRGDAFLSLLLFEADGFDVVKASAPGLRDRKVYKGGSKGAFESLAKVKEGDVIALLNPRILRPFQRSVDKPHPQDNILAVTPDSSESITVIGRARDLGSCNAVRKDGNKCGQWCDKRVADVCEWHLQNAVQRQRSSRPEFSVATGGLNITAKSRTQQQRQKRDYDPSKQWGLAPEQESYGSTYVVSGHVISGSGDQGPSSLYVAENMGRESQAKAARATAKKQEDRMLKSLLSRDREGTRALVEARNHASKEKRVEAKEDKVLEEVANSFDAKDKDAIKRSYSTTVIRGIGFDPTTFKKSGPQKGVDSKKLEELETLRAGRGQIKLTSRPGVKIRSGVHVPPKEERMVDLDSDDDMD